MKAMNKALRLQARIADYEQTIASIKGSTTGFIKPGADANSFGNQGPGKKVNRTKRTSVIADRLRAMAKANTSNADLRRYL